MTGASARAPRRETVVPVSMSAKLDRMLGLEQPDSEKIFFIKLVWTYLLNSFDVFIEPTVASTTSSICSPEPSVLSVLISGGADLYVTSLGSDLLSRLLLITYGTAVAMLVFVAMGSTVTHGV